MKVIDSFMNITLKDIFIFIKKNWSYIIIFALLIFIYNQQSTTPYYKYSNDELRTGFSVSSEEYTDIKKRAYTSRSDDMINENITNISNIVIPQTYAQNQRKIIKTLLLNMEVKDTDQTSEQIKEMVNKYNGFIVSMSSSEYFGKKKQYIMQIKVPQDKYKELSSNLKKIGYVKNEDEKEDDITKTYFDNEERIKNLEAREIKVREFYNNAKNVEETLKVYTELENIRQQIEDLKGQNKNYDYLVNYSTIDITIIPEKEIQSIQEDEWSIQKVWINAVNSLKDFTRNIIEYAIYIFVFGIIWIPLLILFLLWRYFKKRRKTVISSIIIFFIYTISIHTNTYALDNVKFVDMDINGYINSAGDFILQWDKYILKSGVVFSGYKILRSSENKNPIYPNDKEIHTIRDVNITNYTDFNIPEKDLYYRLCYITVGEISCSKNILYVNKSTSTISKSININTISSPINQDHTKKQDSISGYRDTDNHTYQDSIIYLKSKNVISGYEDGTFRPNNYINRAEFVKIIINMLYPDFNHENYKMCFKDVSNQWFASYVCFAKNKNIINGFKDGTFHPEYNINVAEASKILSIVFDKYKNIESEKGSKSWYYDYIYSLTKNNYIPDTIKDPAQKITRGEMAEMIWRIKEDIRYKNGYRFGNIADCIALYEPVCGFIKPMCIQEPCDYIPKTFSNACEASKSGAKDIKMGECDKVIVGDDKDKYGCKKTAGYIWCQEKNKCIRPWEENCINTKETKSNVYTISGCQIFLDDNLWNTQIKNANIHPMSKDYIIAIGADMPIKVNFGSKKGIPINAVSKDVEKVKIWFDNLNNSDSGLYPVFDGIKIENNENKRTIIIEKDNCILYELKNLYKTINSWNGEMGVIFDLMTSNSRPEGKPSIEKSGVSLTAGMIKYGEILSGQINHAIAIKVPKLSKGYILPATNDVSEEQDIRYPIPGMRLKLKDNYDISSFTGQSKIILEAMKNYGVIIIGTGEAWEIDGEIDSRWDDEDLKQLKKVFGNAFEVLK